MRGVTLEEISAATRISLRFLEALESEQWDSLPGGIFNRGFIRAVARFLGLNEESLVAEYAHPTLGTLRQFGHTIGFSDTPGRIQGPPPRVGEHTQEILEELGCDRSEIDELRRAGVVTWPDDDYPWRW